MSNPTGRPRTRRHDDLACVQCRQRDKRIKNGKRMSRCEECAEYNRQTQADAARERGVPETGSGGWQTGGKSAVKIGRARAFAEALLSSVADDS